MKNLSLIFLLIFAHLVINAQEVVSSHKIEQIGKTNEYTILTTISGLEGVELAKIEYQIPDKHIYKASPKNSFFTDRKENLLRFYVMAVPTDGTILIEYNIIINEVEDVVFPVQFQYSKNEEKNKVSLPSVHISNETKVTALVNNTKTTTIKTEEEETITQKTSYEEKEDEKEIVVAEPTKPKKVETPINKPSKPAAENSSGKYAVQLFALSEYSQVKVFTYCRKHNLNTKDISTENVNGLVKVRYGKLDSDIAAQQLKQELINKGVTGVFVVKLP